jgi:glutaredoxin
LCKTDKKKDKKTNKNMNQDKRHPCAVNGSSIQDRIKPSAALKKRPTCEMHDLQNVPNRKKNKFIISKQPSMQFPFVSPVGDSWYNESSSSSSYSMSRHYIKVQALYGLH